VLFEESHRIPEGHLVLFVIDLELLHLQLLGQGQRHLVMRCLALGVDLGQHFSYVVVVYLVGEASVDGVRLVHPTSTTSNDSVFLNRVRLASVLVFRNFGFLQGDWPRS